MRGRTGMMIVFLLSSILVIGCSSTQEPNEYSVAARYGVTDKKDMQYSGTTGKVYFQDAPVVESDKVDWGVEFSGYRISGGTDDVELSAIPKLRYRPSEENSLYVAGGVGPAWNNLAAETDLDLGGTFFFASELGVGYQYSISDTTRLYGGVIARHISNAGLADENEGLNMLLMELGIGW